MPQITREFIKALAANQGLQISDDRLELVKREYEYFKQLAEEIEQMKVPPETEPDTRTG